MSADSVIVRTAGAVSIVELNRPNLLNALDAGSTTLLIDALRAADADEQTGSIVLTGAGRAFCAGGDVRNLGTPPANTRVVHRDSVLHHTLRSLDKPIIAMVNGPAIGLGLSIALACDVVFVAVDAKLGDTHVPLGVVAGDGVMLQLLLDIGPARTKEFLLRAGLIDGARAAALGMVNRAVESNALERETMAFAAEVASLPRFAVRSTKAAVDQAVRWITRFLLDGSLALEAIAMGLPEHPAAVEQFMTTRRKDADT